MTKKRRLAIIRDVLAIYQKYDEYEISDAIEVIRRGEALNDILTFATLSRDLAAKVPNAKRTSVRSNAKSRNSKDRYNNFVKMLEEKPNEHNDQIVPFIKAIAERQLLQSVGSLREFTKILDVNVPTTKVDRYVVAKKIGEALLQRLPRELKEIIEMAMQFGGESSSLHEWSKIIVKK